MVSIIFESHGTSIDNENHVSSGHFDTELSVQGKKQAHELGDRYPGDTFDAVFCSDLQRSYKTARIAFGSKYPIIKDKRLRECDYGNLTRHASSEVEPQKLEHLKVPFQNGESYEQASARVKDFLEHLKKNHDGKKVMIIGHRATQFGLENIINKIPLDILITSTFKWQPGWAYQLK